MCTRAVCRRSLRVKGGRGLSKFRLCRFADPHKHKIVAKSTSR